MPNTTTTTKTPAFMKSLKPSPALAAIVGSEPLPRTEVTKRLWDYIKAHNLQNPANKRKYDVIVRSLTMPVGKKDQASMDLEIVPH